MRPPPSFMGLLCPAKINLHLRVGPPQGDGFHPVLSWMTTVGLFDVLTLQAMEAEPDADQAEPAPPRIVLTCDSPDVPSDASNLVVRVAAAWGSAAAAATRWAGRIAGGARDGGALHAALQKRIPAGAGLGGGSSDAAHALLGLNRIWETNAGTRELAAFAARFGSDVPFFLQGPSAVCTGRGDIIRPIPPPRPRWVLLILPPIHLSTPDVYRQFDAMRLGASVDLTTEPDWAAWASLDAAALLPRLVNDLEPPAFALRPDLGEMRTAIEQTLGQPVRMSGSGSSMFTLYDHRADAEAAGAVVAGRLAVRAEAVEMAPTIHDL